MVNAGAAIDDLLTELVPLLDENDVIVDCGNSHYLDTATRIKKLKENKIHFIGAGVSGGEEGALKGPSIMPGGDLHGYNYVKDLLESIAAKDKSGNPCCSFIGTDGSGHFIKMVHNGIEYAEMQLLAEIYIILRKGLLLNPEQIAAIFYDWNKGDLQSYLLQITIDILRKKENDKWLIDDIVGVALSKGTGRWAAHAAVDLGTPAGMMTAALFARFNSEKNSDAAPVQCNSHNATIAPAEPIHFRPHLHRHRDARVVRCRDRAGMDAERAGAGDREPDDPSFRSAAGVSAIRSARSSDAVGNAARLSCTAYQRDAVP